MNKSKQIENSIQNKNLIETEKSKQIGHSNLIKNLPPNLFQFMRKRFNYLANQDLQCTFENMYPQINVRNNFMQ